jgi:hypothetical protein
MIAAERLVEKHLTQNQMFDSSLAAGQARDRKASLIYISWYINGCGQP